MIKVLIIDDEEDISHNIKVILLKRLEGEILSASGFSEAMDILKTYSPQLVFLDINLGDGNGYDLLPVIKPDMRPKPIIVMMSANDAEKEKTRVKDMGADFFMQKPFTKERIFKVLDEMNLN